MLGERDCEFRRAACSSSPPVRANNPHIGGMGPPAPPCSSGPLYCSPQRPSQPQHLTPLHAGSFALFGTKTEPSDTQEAEHAVDTMNTRQPSLVAPSSAQEEPEHEQEAARAENPKAVEPKKPQVHVIKRRNVGVPKFLRFLFQILEVEDPGIITWSHEGTAFQIVQPEELANQILPKYFKHNKVSSFQRQLNYFGFKKWTKTQTNTCTFSHPFFLRADKDRMKLIKRKERANPAVMSAAIAATLKANPIELMNRMHAQEQAQAQAQAQFEPHDLAEARSQLPTQQALKRQKSNTLSGATVTFLNSAAAGRRHSTGMLPGSEAFGLAAAAAAAAAAAQSAPGRKRAGTPGEQEFELEMEAQADAMANASSMQQQFLYLRKIAEARDLSQRNPYEAGRGKRQSLPHVLPPGFGDTFAMGLSMNPAGNGSFAPRGGVNLGRRRSDQLLTDYNLGGNSGCKPLSISQIEDFMSSTTASSLPQTIFASSGKSDASVVLPISTNSFGQDAYQLQRQGQQRHEQQQQQQFRQQMSRQQNGFGSGYGVKSESGSGWSTSIKTESCGWPTSINVNSASGANASYPPQLQSNSGMVPFKFGDSNSLPNMPSYQGPVGFPHSSGGGERRLQPRPQVPQQYQSQQARTASYQQQQQQTTEEEEPRDYIDVLLESAGLDDNLPPQAPESWNEPGFIHSQHEPSSSGPYAFLQPQQQGQPLLQLSPMGGMPHNPNQRF
jgi:hypothetical protein